MQTVKINDIKEFNAEKFLKKFRLIPTKLFLTLFISNRGNSCRFINTLPRPNFFILLKAWANLPSEMKV